jgi:NAD-dependent dihydropyrimidine dehydrogenase PreA subunit
MRRTIIKIDAAKCNGCGLCIAACHEGAIGMIDGKAALLRDDYCDGLGNCLPACPAGAIAFEEREALPYNEAEVKKNAESAALIPATQLRQWPVQIKLVPVNAPYFEQARLLVSADCVAYAHGNFHHEFMRDKITLIGCPKLDQGDYSGKLADIFKSNQLKAVTVVRMEVPCCGGLEQAVKTALNNCGKMLPWQVVTISTEGRVLEYISSSDTGLGITGKIRTE